MERQVIFISESRLSIKYCWQNTYGSNLIYIYIYIYIYLSGDSSLFLLLVPPHSVNFSSQPVVRGPKVSHHSCYCVILHCIAQIDKRNLHGVFSCKQSRYYIICSLVNTVDKIIFFPFKSIEEKRRCSLLWREKYVY